MMIGLNVDDKESTKITDGEITDVEFVRKDKTNYEINLLLKFDEDTVLKINIPECDFSKLVHINSVSDVGNRFVEFEISGTCQMQNDNSIFTIIKPE